MSSKARPRSTGGPGLGSVWAETGIGTTSDRQARPDDSRSRADGWKGGSQISVISCSSQCTPGQVWGGGGQYAAMHVQGWAGLTTEQKLSCAIQLRRRH